MELPVLLAVGLGLLLGLIHFFSENIKLSEG
jgi:hypothetical protein